MKKSFIGILLCAAALSVNAVDIELVNGVVYRNAKVLQCGGDGVLVRIPTGVNASVTEQIPYSNLTNASLRKIANLPSVQSGSNIPSVLKPFSTQFTVRTAGPTLAITLDSITMYGNGTIGWANSNPGWENNVSYGRIYVYNLQVPGLNNWEGVVYPTNQIVRAYRWVLPCYAVSRTDAWLLNSRGLPFQTGP